MLWIYVGNGGVFAGLGAQYQAFLIGHHGGELFPSGTDGAQPSCDDVLFAYFLGFH